MRIDGPSIAHVRAVADSMRETDVAEFLAVSHASRREQLADLLVAKYGEADDTFCFSDGDKPVAVGAMVHARPNVITLMFFATEHFTQIALPLARWTRNHLFPRYRNVGVHRIECVSIAGYSQAHKWIRLLGLQEEATMPGYGKNGETFHQFAWVAEHVRQAGN